MTFEADQIVDRRRLRRKLSFWRVIAVLALILAVAGGTMIVAGRDMIPKFSSPQIARVTLSGFIMDDRERDEMMETLAKNDAVKAVIVSIDSTGGATTVGFASASFLRLS